MPEETKRLSVDLPAEHFDELNKYMQGYRLKSALYCAITEQLLSKMRHLTDAEKRVLIVSIIQNRISINEYLSLKG